MSMTTVERCSQPNTRQGYSIGELAAQRPTLIMSIQLGCEVVALALVVFFGLAAVFVADFADMLNR
jgi:hypothetical protein